MFRGIRARLVRPRVRGKGAHERFFGVGGFVLRFFGLYLAVLWLYLFFVTSGIVVTDYNRVGGLRANFGLDF